MERVVGQKSKIPINCYGERRSRWIEEIQHFRRIGITDVMKNQVGLIHGEASISVNDDTIRRADLSAGVIDVGTIIDAGRLGAKAGGSPKHCDEQEEWSSSMNHFWLAGIVTEEQKPGEEITLEDPSLQAGLPPSHGGLIHEENH